MSPAPDARDGADVEQWDAAVVAHLGRRRRTAALRRPRRSRQPSRQAADQRTQSRRRAQQRKDRAARCPSRGSGRRGSRAAGHSPDRARQSSDARRAQQNQSQSRRPSCRSRRPAPACPSTRPCRTAELCTIGAPNVSMPRPARLAPARACSRSQSRRASSEDVSPSVRVLTTRRRRGRPCARAAPKRGSIPDAPHTVRGTRSGCVARRIGGISRGNGRKGRAEKRLGRVQVQAPIVVLAPRACDHVARFEQDVRPTRARQAAAVARPAALAPMMVTSVSSSSTEPPRIPRSPELYAKTGRRVRGGASASFRARAAAQV